jgi:hypothetical protein
MCKLGATLRPAYQRIHGNGVTMHGCFYRAIITVLYPTADAQSLRFLAH